MKQSDLTKGICVTMEFHLSDISLSNIIVPTSNQTLDSLFKIL